MYEEGEAKIKYADNAFLNPKARLSRDLSIAFVQAIKDLDGKDELSVIDATSATGIRGVRYYKELGIKDITMLEINNDVFKDLKNNIKFNGMDKLDTIRLLNESIQDYANSKDRERFDVIDLDPFGSAAPDIYDIMKLVKGDSYLMVTSTDAAVLCGAHYDACLKVYSAQPLHNQLCHEIGTRILIGYISKVAGLFNFYIEPEISISYLHYIRVFLKLKHGAKGSSKNFYELGYVSYCNTCGNFELNSVLPKSLSCNVCGDDYKFSGPLWISSIQNKKFTSDLKEVMHRFDYPKDEIKFIDELNDELDIPLYYSIPKLTKGMGIRSISYRLIMQKLTEEGYKVSKTHFLKECIKTDAGLLAVKSAILSCSQDSPKDYKKESI